MQTGQSAGETAYANKRGIWGWMFFDWAAQPFHTLIITFIFAPYFTSHVMDTPEHGQEVWGYTIGIAGFLVAILAPVLGAIADAAGPRKPWIIGFAGLAIIGSFSLWFALPGSGASIIVIGAIILAFIGFEFAAVFNNAMMPTLVAREELGRLSGSAWGFGYLGGLVTLIVMLGFLVAQGDSGKTIIGVEPLFGLSAVFYEGDRVSGPLTAIWFLIFIIPMMIFTPDIARRPSLSGAVGKGLKQLGATLKSLPKDRNYFSFLLSSMFYRDGLNALYAFGGIYAAGVLNWTIIQLGIFGILANLTGAFGGWLGGKLDHRFSSRFVVTGSILLLIVTCVLVIGTTRSSVLFMFPIEQDSTLPDLIFYICGGLIGAAGGALQGSSRVLLVNQAPKEKLTEAFGLYALSGRATSFIGPLAIAWATGFFDSQRLGVSPVVVLFVIGLLLLAFVRNKPRAVA